MTTDPMAEIKATFFLECDELLETLLEGLETLSSGTGTSDTIHAVFRAVHSVKGGAGAFGLKRLVEFAHSFENVLDLVRSEKLTIDEDLLALCFRSADLLSDLVRAGQSNSQTNQTEEDNALVALSAYANTIPSDEPAEEVAFQPMGLDLALDLDDLSPLDNSESHTEKAISFRPDISMFLAGHEPIHILRALQNLGARQITCHCDEIPAIAQLSAEDQFLHWSMTIPAEIDDDEIETIFEFVEGLCEFKIQPMSEAELEPVAQEEFLMDVQNDAGPLKIEPVQTLQPESSHPPKPNTVDPAPTVRVELNRIDRLVNLVGELVINQAMLAQSSNHAQLDPSSPILSGLDEFLQLTRNIQDSVMMIRAQPVKSLFQRMGRIVREAARETGKSVSLKLVGEETEIDKTVIEKLVEPLTHMIRNAVDHGLENSEDRTAAGKPEQGTVTLSAHHKSGRVIINIRDDGRGLNNDKIVARAIERGLIEPNANLTDAEIASLLFHPGFSTADKVTDLSGRGVGMDVVKRAINTLGGRVAISSEPGIGTCFDISLPLTLAILDGMIVEVADQTLVIPLATIVETISFNTVIVTDLTANEQVIQLRDEILPLYDLGKKLGFRENQSIKDDCIILKIHTDEGVDCALIVDEIVEQRQVVIKGLQENYGNIPGIAAATILGDGQIALILDPIAMQPGQISHNVSSVGAQLEQSA